MNLINLKKKKRKSKRSIIKRPCIHFKMVNYIDKIKNNTLLENYKFYQIVFNNYLNTDFIMNLDEVYEEETNINKNYAVCNI